MIICGSQHNVVKHLVLVEDAVWKKNDEDEGRGCGENVVQQVEDGRDSGLP